MKSYFMSWPRKMGSRTIQILASTHQAIHGRAISHPFVGLFSLAGNPRSCRLTKSTISKEHVPDNIYDQARQQFTDDELVKLTLAVVAINSWNRFGIAFRAIPGKYQPSRHHETAMA